jgi:anthranilate phosphoribosyltransferase
MIQNYLKKIFIHESLSFDEAKDVMCKIMTGKVNNSQIASLLTAIKIKGAAPSELAGFITGMTIASKKINIDNENLLDVCGTGGDSSGTFNISTVVSFVLAAAGYKVAKHGNRSITSKSGSADVLSELGIDINFNEDIAKNALEEIGIAFIFAPNFHPAMKFAMPVRKELGFKTIFNILGPLTNPANTKRQLIGTYSNKTAELMCDALKYLEMDRVAFICTSDSFDEITLTDDTLLIEYDSQQGTKKSVINNDLFGYPLLKWNDLQGGNPSTNAKIFIDILSAKKVTPQVQVVAANAAVALKIAGFSDNLVECKNFAEELILSGNSFQKFNELKNFSKAR